MRLSFAALLCVLLLCAAIWGTDANPESGGRVRVRRDMQGLFDHLGDFLKKDEKGQTKAGNLLQATFSAMGSAMSQLFGNKAQPQAGAS